MKRQVLFVQGAGARVHDEWDNKLVESLTRELGPEYDVQYPRMPGEDDPNVAAWTAALRTDLEALHDGAVAVGHSVGGTILINMLAEQPPPLALGAIVLIAAPFVGEGGWESDDWQSSGDLGARLPRGVPIHLYHGTADRTVPPSHADFYARVIPQARLCLLAGRDHQLNDDLREIAEVITMETAHPVRYREATSADVPAMERCRAMDTAAGPADRRMAAYLDGRHHPQQALAPRTAFVALVGDDVVGYIAGHATTRYGCSGEVQYLYVAPHYRRRGVARRLLQSMARWFRTQNIRCVCVNADIESEGAVPFYSALGAVPLNKHWYVWEEIASTLDQVG